MHPDLDNKNGVLVVRLILFSCALFVVLAGIVGAFVLSFESAASDIGLEHLATVRHVGERITQPTKVARGILLQGLSERSPSCLKCGSNNVNRFFLAVAFSDFAEYVQIDEGTLVIGVMKCALEIVLGHCELSFHYFYISI